MSIRTVIVDDVELARRGIRMMIDDPEIEIVAECKNGRQAIEAITTLRPDLIFLDVQMPKIGGFDVIAAIGVESMPSVIFVTAYEEFAIKAFEINAVDYLLKPFNEERLAKALERAKREIHQQEPSSAVELKLKNLIEAVGDRSRYLKRIPIKSSRGTTLVLTEDIDWISAAGQHNLELHVGSRTHLMRESLSRIEQMLDPGMFMRIHRSTIVNLNRIQSLHDMFSGDQLIILSNGKELNLSRTYSEKLMARLLR